MIIEDAEAFKAWLTAILKPICEADPITLAKYVMALVKKDKPVEVLRDCMISQLEVFLQQETEPFVNQLFKSLETHDYIQPVIPNTNPPNPIITKGEAPVALLNKVIHKPLIPVNEIAANITETLNGKGVLKDKETDLTKKEVIKTDIIIDQEIGPEEEIEDMEYESIDNNTTSKQFFCVPMTGQNLASVGDVITVNNTLQKNLTDDTLKRDEYAIFGELVANKLRKVSFSNSCKVIIAQQKISDILFEL